MLVFDVGYRYLARLDQPSENRIELDVTPQIPLLEGSRHAIAAESTFDLFQATAPPGAIEIALSMQRTFSVRRFVFFPYAQGDFFYSSSPGSWNKTTFTILGPSPLAVNAFGMTA